MSEAKKEYDPQFGFWPNKSGKPGANVYIDEALLATLNKAKIGGRLFLAEVPAEVRKKNNKMPSYRITIFPPDEKAQDTSETI